MKKPVSVLVVVHSADLQVLLIERSRHPGYWQSVTGSQEGDEAPRLTARRELEEETGLRVTEADLVAWPVANRYEIFPEWRDRYAPGVTHNLEYVFSVCLPAPREVRLAPAEHRAQRWLPWREAAAACFSWSNRDAILMLPWRQS